MCSTWLSSSIGVQPDASRVVRCSSVREGQHRLGDRLAEEGEVRREAGRLVADRSLGFRSHYAGPIQFPSASQCSATFFDGCTRGGSPGILG